MYCLYMAVHKHANKYFSAIQHMNNLYESFENSRDKAKACVKYLNVKVGTLFKFL